MAVTLTSSQVTFSSYGPLEGVYQGASSTNTAYPIGTYMFGYGDPCASTLTSAQVYPGTASGYLAFYNPRSLFSGTWRIRGNTGAGLLCERTA